MSVTITERILTQESLNSGHDPETEVLTNAGWRRFADLTGVEQLATVNPKTSELIYELPARLVALNHDGPLYVIEKGNADFAVTADHKMLVRRWDQRARTLSSDYSFVEARKLGWYAGLMSQVVWRGKPETRSQAIYLLPGVDNASRKAQRVERGLPMEVWLRFLGIYLAEGTMLKRDQHKGHISYKIQIAASKPREKDFVREVLADLGVVALELKDRFTFSNMQIYEAMAQLGLLGIKAPQKFVPSFVFDRSAELIREFLWGHFMGDGCEQNGLRAHYTSSGALAEDIQRLVFLSGDESLIGARPPRESITKDGREMRGVYPEYRVSVRSRKGSSIDCKADIKTRPYEGKVYCAEMPTYHTLVTRRNGKILTSGIDAANTIVAATSAITGVISHPSEVLAHLA